MGRDAVTQEYAFNVRQTNYYTDAAIYLGLVRKSYDDKHSPRYSLSVEGKKALRLDYKRRQLKFCELILRHKPFYDTFIKTEEEGKIPEKEEIVEIMKSNGLYNVEKDSTYERRASTISRWIYWIFSIINED